MEGSYVEIWKPVVGYEGLYSVSSFGRVRRDCGTSGSHIGLILKQAIRKDGYPQISLYRNRTKTPFKVHRLMALCFMGVRPEGYQVNHKDGNKSNNCINNLEYVTPYRIWKHY